MLARPPSGVLGRPVTDASFQNAKKAGTYRTRLSVVDLPGSGNLPVFFLQPADLQIAEHRPDSKYDHQPAAARHASVRHTVVNRIAMAIPCPAPGTECKRPSTTTQFEGLYLAGDWTRTELPASMESAVHSGLAAAEEIWSAIGRPRRLVVPKRPTEGLAGWMRERQ